MVIQDSMTWRVVRFLFPNCGTPVTLTPEQVDDVLSLVEKFQVSERECPGVYDLIDSLQSGKEVIVVD